MIHHHRFSAKLMNLGLLQVNNACVTEAEILKSLKTIRDDKAPGLDGYNAVFFKKTWKIIKHDIISTIQAFFDTGKLYKPLNCALVTLVPKI